MGEIDKDMEVVLDDDIQPVEVGHPEPVKVEKETVASNIDENKLVNCLRNERVVVEFIPQERGLITDSRHVLYGGLGEESKRRFVVPVLQSGVYKNVLTNDEKDYLEYIMGMQPNALSIYRREDNYWSNRGVVLGKYPTILDLTVPEDYISYKILLANDDYIAPSKDILRSQRKATYQFVLSKEGEDIVDAVHSLNVTSEAFMLFGEIKDNIKKLAIVLEHTTGRMISNKNKEYVYAQVEKAIKHNAAKFVESAKDPMLDMKILIRDAIDVGYVRRRGQYYYLTEGNKPMAIGNQEPTLQSACEFLSLPKNQEILFTLQGHVNKD